MGALSNKHRQVAVSGNYWLLQLQQRPWLMGDTGDGIHDHKPHERVAAHWARLGAGFIPDSALQCIVF